jgi:hypothetical protein
MDLDRNESLSSEKASFELKYEEKNAECEEMVLLLHRSRNDLNKRMERQQKDSENKINFLIQQLRNSEVKLQENSLLFRSSFDMLDLSKKRSDEQGTMSRTRGEDMEEEEEEGEGEREGDGKRQERKRPHTTPNLKGSSGRSVEVARDAEEGSDQQRQRQEEEDKMKLINDLKRKLDTERYRREILEKRNGELMRELRQLKEKK